MEERNSNYELQPARNGLTVPVINGVYLHSIYNPTKEAEALGKAHEKTLETKSKVLVLGLGFGYHIEEIAKIMRANHKDYEIVILEPNQRLVNDFVGTRNFDDKNIKIICEQSVRDLFEDWNFIQFLMNKPSIIKHDTSFILEKDFFTSFLAFQAPKDIISYRRVLSEEAKEVLDTSKGRDFNSSIAAIQNSGRISSKSDYLMLTLNEVLNNTTEG